MQVSILHPPNLQTLSPDVIGSVVQRSRIPLYRHTTTSLAPVTTALVEPCPFTQAEDDCSGRSSPTDTKQSDKKRASAAEGRVGTAAYQREKRRLKQERYRARQRKLAAELEAGNQQLQAEIRQLESKLYILSLRPVRRATVWSVAVEYFRVFRRGLIAPERKRHAGLTFLRATIAPDVDAGTVHGFDMLMKYWEIFALAFQDVNFQQVRLDEIAENLLVATTTTSITITSHSLRTMFPGLVRDDTDHRKKSQWHHIADKLQGRRLVMRGTVRFTWDSMHSRVVGLISQSDMVSPLLQLLGNLEDVSAVFSNALITPECNLVRGKQLDQCNLDYFDLSSLIS